MSEIRNVGAAQPSAKKPEGGEQKKPAKSFRETLQEKKTEPQPPQPFGALPQQAFQMEDVAPAEQTQAATNLDSVAAVQALMNEIVDRVEMAGPGEVRIEFQSTVLDGVVVTAQRDGNALDVRFESATPETAKLLAGNSPVLAERLERRGYTTRIAVARKQLDQQQPQQQDPRQ